MLLTQDYISPAELTGFARAALADLEQNRFTLSRWLPSRAIDDLLYRFDRGGGGLAEAATFRSYDAESPIGKREGKTRVTGELPPISRKIRLGEYEQLRLRRAGDQQVRDAILGDARNMVRAVAARMELARGQALYTATVAINENGVVATADFGRSGSHTVAPATLWSDATNSDPIADLMAWSDTYEVSNGVRPEVALTSSRVTGYLMRNAKIRALAATLVGTPSLVSVDSVQAVLASFGLPRIETYQAQVAVSGVATRPIPDDRVVLLPEPDSDETNELGSTLWGTTAEALSDDFDLDGEDPGIVAGAYRTNDPVAYWTKAAGIGLPVLANPNLTLTADVA